MAKIQHTHKLKRLRYKSGNEVFFCTLPDCSFKSNIALALGKRSLCWRCGSEFLMDEYSLRLAKPHCPACHRPKNLQELSISEEVLEPTILVSNGSLSLSERLAQTIKNASEKASSLVEEDI